MRLRRKFFGHQKTKRLAVPLYLATKMKQRKRGVMPNANMIKGNYLGKRGNPFHQFEKVVLSTSQMKRDIHADPAFYLNLAIELIEDPKPDAARKLLAYRILAVLNGLGDKKYADAYRATIFQMRSAGFWIEKAFCAAESLSQAENTLFAPQPFHFGENSYSNELRNHIRQRTPETSRDALWRAITRIHEVTTEAADVDSVSRKSIFFDPIFGQGLMLLDALGEVHFEASDNASRHALHTDDNPYSFDSDDEGFFGDIQYLQMTAISHLAGDKRQRNDWPQAIQAYVESYLSARNVKGGRFLMFSYVDNGPGIVEHVSKFSPEAEKTPSSIGEVIEGRLTSSDVVGAGYGLSNMREAIQSVAGFIYIQSGKHTHHFSGLDGTTLDGIASLGRGTLLTFVVPA